MNGCNEHTDKQLRNYFLNRLTSDEMGEFQFHLLHCQTCRDRLERMRLLAAEWQEELPEEKQVTAHSFRLFTRITAVAGVALLLAGGGYYFMSTPADTEFTIEMNEAPVFHSADSVAVDSMAVDSMVVDSVGVQLDNRYVRDEE